MSEDKTGLAGNVFTQQTISLAFCLFGKHGIIYPRLASNLIHKQRPPEFLILLPLPPGLL